MKGALLLVLVGSCQAQADHPEPPMQCPGAPDGLLSHAKASLFLNPKASCPIVEAEIRARVKGVNGWVDPHNHGTYTMLHDEAGVMRLKRVTGNGKYTDMLMFTFSDWGGDYGCQVTACSESQVNSFLDMSTNFCNLHNLYCGKQDGCPVADQDIGEYKEELRTFSRGAGKDKSKCIVKETAVASVAAAEPTVESVAAKPCCKTCTLPLVKYYSVDRAHGFCGDACMDPKKFSIYKKFEANLTLVDASHPDCSGQYTPDGKFYTDYDSTVTHGDPFGILAVTLDLYAPTGMPDHSCCSSPIVIPVVGPINCNGKPKNMTIRGTGPYCCPASSTEEKPCSKVAFPKTCDTECRGICCNSGGGDACVTACGCKKGSCPPEAASLII